MTALPPKGDGDKKIGAIAAPLSVSAQDTPNMTVKIRAGSFFNAANAFVEYGGGNSPVITAPVGNPKWVLVALLDSGSVVNVDGTPASIPNIPAPPAGSMPLAAVYVTPTTTSITTPLIADVRPFLRSMDIVPNLTSELANRPTANDLTNALATKADVEGTPATSFTMNADFTAGAPNADIKFAVSRGAAPEVSIRWNESVDIWELTNDGVTFSPIASVSGTFAPLVHTHVAADVTNFASATNALIALATIAQSQVTGLVADLAAKASTAALTAHTADAAIHFTLPIAQSGVTGLVADLASKVPAAGGTMTGNLTVQTTGNQPISLVSDDTGSSGLLVSRGVNPSARLEWDETSSAWMAGTVGSMNTLLTGALVGTFVPDTRQVLAGSGLTGGGALSANVTISMPTIGAPVTNQLRKITTDVQGRVSATSAVVGADLPTHTHVAADVTDFVAAVDAALPNVGTPVVSSFVKITTDTEGRVSGTTPVVAGDLPAHTHVAADVTDFAAAVEAALPNVGSPVVASFVKITTDTEGRVSGTTPVVAGDITTLVDAMYVNVAGDAMTGALAMGANKITGLAAGTAPGDAVRYDEFNGHTHAAADVTSGAFADARIAASNVTQHQAAIDHDALTNFVANEHVDHSAVTLTAGVGLTGGGDIAASRTFNVAAIKGTLAFTFGAIADGAAGDSTNTLTVTGAVVGDVVQLGLPAAPAAGFTYQGFVSAADTVTVRAVNNGGGVAAGDANATISVIVMQYAEF